MKLKKFTCEQILYRLNFIIALNTKKKCYESTDDEKFIPITFLIFKITERVLICKINHGSLTINFRIPAIHGQATHFKNDLWHEIFLKRIH